MFSYHVVIPGVEDDDILVTLPEVPQPALQRVGEHLGIVQDGISRLRRTVNKEDKFD